MMVHPLFLDVSPMVPIIGALIAAATAIYLLLPRPYPYPSVWGAGIGALALLLFGTQVIAWGPLTVETGLFGLFATMAIVFGALMVTQRDPARSALSFAMVVLSVCGLFLLQAAPFLMAATIIIYTGAIIVTFLFVLMLAQQHGQSDADYRSREAFLSTAAGFVLLGALLYVLKSTYDTQPLDQVLARIDAAKAGGPDAIQKLLDDKRFTSDWQAALRRARPDVAAEIADEIHNLQGAGDDSLTEIETILARARATTGDLQPRAFISGDGKSPLRLSPFSGPPTNELSSPAVNERILANGTSPLPAQNVLGLGRSLFTDYLVSVELGGTLLLVATIGAIAITGRRGERTI